MRTVVVSYYTPDYEADAKRLIESLDKFHVEHHVEPMEDRGGWFANCAFKPIFLWDRMNRFYGRPVCWVDADAVVRKEPVLFDEYAEGKADVGYGFGHRDGNLVKLWHTTCTHRQRVAKCPDAAPLYYDERRAKRKRTRIATYTPLCYHQSLKEDDQPTETGWRSKP